MNNKTYGILLLISLTATVLKYTKYGVLIELFALLVMVGVFLIVFLSNKEARENFKKFWKEHKIQIILFLLLFLLPLIFACLMPFLLS